MTTLPTLFCPDCRTYIGPSVPACFCGWQRVARERLAPQGTPLWSAQLDGAIRGRVMLTEKMALFAWSTRPIGGGVAAFDQQTGESIWTTEAGSAIESGLTLTQDVVLFATLGFVSDSAEVHCHRLQDGTLLWRKPVSKSVWGAPVVREERVYVGCMDGQIHCFDLRTGTPIPRWQVMLPAGRNWLTFFENNLYALTQPGIIFRIDPLNGNKKEIAGLKEEVNAGFAQGAGRLFTGTDSGNVYAIDPRTHEIKRLLTGCKRIHAEPYYHNGKLYVGGFDHLLHALDLKSGAQIWQQHCGEHSVASSPVVADGLVFVGGNAGAIYAFDTQDGTPVWEHPFKNTPAVMSSPAYANGVVYIGAQDGAVHAFPWHLGRYDWAANHLKRLGESVRAAAHFAIAREQETRDLSRKESYTQAAIQNWKDGGLPVLAVRFREALPGQHFEVLAREYEEAGSLTDNANLLRRAAEYYEEAEDKIGAQRCNQMAVKLSHGPYLSPQIVNLPPHWEAGEEGDVVFDLKNRGVTVAHNIRIRLTGNLTMRMWVEMSGTLAPGASIEVTAKITPTGLGHLVIEPHYTDNNDTKWVVTRQFPFDVKSSATVHVQGDVGALELNDKLLQSKVKIRGDVGLIKVKAVTAEIIPIPHCSICGAKLSPDNVFCDQCGTQL